MSQTNHSFNPSLSSIDLLLPCGRKVILDNDWFAMLSQIAWRSRPDCRTYYAVANVVRPNGRRGLELMHRVIMDAPKGIRVDHINGNGLDNRRDNLRFASPQLNAANRNSSWGSSQFVGVSFDRQTGLWRATLQHDGKTIHIGRFRDEEAAADAYQQKRLAINKTLSV